MFDTSLLLSFYPESRRFKVTAEQPPEGGNLLTLPYRRLQLLPNCDGDRLDVARPINFTQDAARAVVVHDRYGVLNVDVDPLRNDLVAIVLALIELAPIEIADAFPLGRIDAVVVGRLTGATGPPPGGALDED